VRNTHRRRRRSECGGGAMLSWRERERERESEKEALGRHDTDGWQSRAMKGSVRGREMEEGHGRRGNSGDRLGGDLRAEACVHVCVCVCAYGRTDVTYMNGVLNGDLNGDLNGVLNACRLTHTHVCL
jgi:hypothetical protein